MPRVVDRGERKRHIARTALRILQTEGPAGVTLRRIAEDLGGSITLVTHFYGSRDELMEAVLEAAFADYEVELERLERGADARERLLILVQWMLPLDEEGRLQEKGRLLMLGQLGPDPAVRRFVDAMEARMTGLLRQHLSPLVPATEVDGMVDVLRVMTNGMALSVVERGERWPASHQRATLNAVVAALGLDVPAG
ncbi:TetR family transcriptional regulator C-terminal domain-containing protein [Streptomyces sp. NPDC002088]|uniref:TetR/AcrR family transcriptional regulator n=1 Tax=Streptomyces sp. NPDC002088 TaxID=3154665 RepID=UPI00331D86AA